MKPISIKRVTNEVKVNVDLNIYGKGEASIDTGLTFFDHLLITLTKHAMFNLEIRAAGDLKHHIIEDVGICLGLALKDSLSEKISLTRYGFQYVPMDEALARAVVDICGRSSFVLRTNASLKEEVEDLVVEDINHFLETLAINAQITLHLEILYGQNSHHMLEALFKALAHAIRIAITKRNDLEESILSAKGVLD